MLGANCGDGLWVLCKGSSQRVIESVRKAEENAVNETDFVLQRYVESPLLWEDKFKYHSRIYLVMQGNGAVYLYKTYLIHVANLEYDSSDLAFRDQMHITNVAMNKGDEARFHGCPVRSFSDPVDPLLIATLMDTFQQAARFMGKQVSGRDFLHLGLDVLYGSDGQPFILECNIPPCAGMYGDEMEAEMSAFFDQMFTDIVTAFAIDGGEFKDAWHEVCGGKSDFLPCKVEETGLNALRWAMYARNALKTQEKEGTSC